MAKEIYYHFLTDADRTQRVSSHRLRRTGDSTFSSPMEEPYPHYTKFLSANFLQYRDKIALNNKFYSIINGLFSIVAHLTNIPIKIINAATVAGTGFPLIDYGLIPDYQVLPPSSSNYNATAGRIERIIRASQLPNQFILKPAQSTKNFGRVDFSPAFIRFGIAPLSEKYTTYGISFSKFFGGDLWINANKMHDPNLPEAITKQLLFFLNNIQQQPSSNVTYSISQGEKYYNPNQEKRIPGGNSSLITSHTT